MIVLGKDSDEKGLQLETLTANLLRALGYTEVSANVVRSGASEVDVVGVYAVPLPGGRAMRVNLVGECKALRRPVDINAWHKLVAKLEAERMKHQAIALLVALDGVTGTVVGAYEEYDRLRPDVVFLYNRDEVEAIAIARYGALDRDAVRTKVAAFTRSKVAELTLAYRDDDVLWIVRLKGGLFAVLDRSGDPLGADEVASMRSLIRSETGVDEWIDLREQGLALASRQRAARTNLAALFAAGGELSEAPFLADPDHDEPDHRASFELLADAGLVRRRGPTLRLSLLDADERHNALVEAIRFFVEGSVAQTAVSTPFCSRLFVDSVDERLARHACRVQGDVPMSETRLNDLVHWMRLSPGAFLTALRPDPVTIQHRVIAPTISPMIDEHDAEHLLESLLNAFLEDLKNPFLGPYFHHKGIYEVDRWTRIVVGSPGGGFEARGFSKLLGVDGRFGMMSGLKQAADLEGDGWDFGAVE